MSDFCREVETGVQSGVAGELSPGQLVGVGVEPCTKLRGLDVRHRNKGRMTLAPSCPSCMGRGGGE